MSNLTNQHLIERLCLSHNFALMAGHQQSSFASLLTSKNLVLIPVALVEKLPEDLPLHDMLASEEVGDETDLEREDCLDIEDDLESAENSGRAHTTFGIDAEDAITLTRVLKALEPHGLS